MQIAIMGHGMTGTVGAGAMTGIDMALWDIKGKALGAPVWNLLGGKVRDRIRIYGHANTPEVALSAEGARLHRDQVRRRLRPGRARSRRCARRSATRWTSMIDLHGPPWLTPGRCGRRCAGRSSPTTCCGSRTRSRPRTSTATRASATHSTCRWRPASGMATIFGERELIERELVDVIQPDTGRAGGITQMKKIAAMAEAHHIMLAPHSGSLGPVAEYAALHLLAAHPERR